MPFGGSGANDRKTRASISPSVADEHSFFGTVRHAGRNLQAAVLARPRGTAPVWMIPSRPGLCTIAGVIMIAAFGPGHANARGVITRYACPSKVDLSVQRNQRTARVAVAGRDYELQRVRSSIGDKYLSPRAALIVDGSSAVFVAEDRPDLPVCVKAIPVASTR